MKQLTPPGPRKLLHTRDIQCCGYERADGLWELEGSLRDVRSYALDGAYGNHARGAGEPLHWMSLRLTIDDDLRIVGAEAVTQQAPYGDCDKINDSYRQLIGLRIEAGFKQAIKTLFGGSHGCTHLTELLGPMATTALQTIRPALALRRGERGPQANPSADAKSLRDTCFALRSGGAAAVVRWGRLEEARDAG